MPKFTAFIHAADSKGLAETLSSATLASEVLVIHDEDPVIEHLCLRHGARSKIQVPGVTPGAYAMDAYYDWLLLLHPGDEFSEETQDALEQWKQRREDNCAGYLIRCAEAGPPELRFVNRAMVNWIGESPPIPTNAGIFPGIIYRTRSVRAA